MEQLELKADETTETTTETRDTIPMPKPRGFAAWDPEKRREAARRGGREAHRQGKAHEFTSEKAREAGRKGGRAVANKKRAAKAAEATGE